MGISFNEFIFLVLRKNVCTFLNIHEKSLNLPNVHEEKNILRRIYMIEMH